LISKDQPKEKDLCQNEVIPEIWIGLAQHAPEVNGMKVLPSCLTCRSEKDRRQSDPNRRTGRYNLLLNAR
jgi:hypothetical protein